MILAVLPVSVAPADDIAGLAAGSELIRDAAQQLPRGESVFSNPDRMKFTGFTQFRWQYNHRDTTPDGSDEDTWGFYVARTRLQMDAKPEQWLSTRLRATFGSNGDLALDHAFATAHLPDGWNLRFGQFALNLFRDDMIAAQRQLAVNSSVVNALYNADKTQGIEIGKEWEKFRFWLSYNDGLRTGNESFSSPRKADWAFSSRGEWQIIGNDWSRYNDYTSFRGSPLACMLGIGVEVESGAQAEGTDSDFALLYSTADVSLQGDGWNTFASVVFVYNDISIEEEGTDWGFILQGGYFLTDQIEAFGRFDMILPNQDRDGVDGNFRTVTTGVNYYISPHSHTFKLTGNALWFLDPQANSLLGAQQNLDLLPSDVDGQWGIQFQVQVVF